MVVVIIATFYDWIVGLDGWMAVPLEITQAWKQALEGNFSSEVVAELASVMGANFLHAGGNHLMGNMLMFWIFGAVVLEIVGWRWLFAIFVLTVIGAATTWGNAGLADCSSSEPQSIGGLGNFWGDARFYGRDWSWRF